MTKVVFHLDADEIPRLVMALNNISNLLKEIPAAEADICLVANGAAVRLFERGHAGDQDQRVASFAAEGVRFFMCNNSLTNLKLEPGNLVDGCEITKAGVLELIERQSAGCAYIKP